MVSLEGSEEKAMQMNWVPEHCDALREYLAEGMSHSEAANAINARFDTAYSRNAAIGRAKRMGLTVCEGRKKKRLPRLPQQLPAPRLRNIRDPAAEPKSLPPTEPTERVVLRCIQILPRHLPLVDLQAGDCRYPYGGDVEGEAISFCGHPQCDGSSYCIGHFHLTRGPGTLSERAAVQDALRLVEAA